MSEFLPYLVACNIRDKVLVDTEKENKELTDENRELKKKIDKLETKLATLKHISEVVGCKLEITGEGGSPVYAHCILNELPEEEEERSEMMDFVTVEDHIRDLDGMMQDDILSLEIRINSMFACTLRESIHDGHGYFSVCSEEIKPNIMTWPAYWVNIQMTMEHEFGGRVRINSLYLDRDTEYN